MLIVRAVTALAATAALFGSLWVSGVFEPPKPSVQWAAATAPPLADTAFGEAFARLANETYFLAEVVDAKGVTQHVTGAANNKLRFEGAEPGVYSIVDRDQVWHVNEVANRAEPARAAYHYRRDGAAALNPWRLVQLEPNRDTELSYREEEVAENNQALLVTHFSARYLGEPVAVESKIDALQKLPRELMIWPHDRQGGKPLAQFHLIQAGGPADHSHADLVPKQDLGALRLQPFGDGRQGLVAQAVGGTEAERQARASGLYSRLACLSKCFLHTKRGFAA
jgi:hypothetical protein